MAKKTMLMIFILLSSSILIHAQEAKTYIGPQLGWQKASDAENGKFMPGGTIRIKFTPSFSFEGSLNYRQEDYSNGNIRVTTWPVMLTGMIYPINTIYGAIGIGWYNTAIDYSSEYHLLGLTDDRQQKFGWHFGAGLELPLSGSERSPGAILTTDFRYVFLNYNFEKVPGSSDIKSNYFVVTLGLLFGI
jgi:opacity protein-like surface antigen